MPFDDPFFLILAEVMSPPLAPLNLQKAAIPMIQEGHQQRGLHPLPVRQLLSARRVVARLVDQRLHQSPSQSISVPVEGELLQEQLCWHCVSISRCSLILLPLIHCPEVAENLYLVKSGMGKILSVG